MKLHEKYLKALEINGDWLTVSELALKVSELYPDILINAEKDALNQKNETTGLRVNCSSYQFSAFSQWF